MESEITLMLSFSGYSNSIISIQILNPKSEILNKFKFLNSNVLDIFVPYNFLNVGQNFEFLSFGFRNYLGFRVLRLGFSRAIARLHCKEVLWLNRLD